MYRIEFTYEEMIDSIKNISDQLSKSKFDPDIIVSVNEEVVFLVYIYLITKISLMKP